MSSSTRVQSQQVRPQVVVHKIKIRYNNRTAIPSTSTNYYDRTVAELWKDLEALSTSDTTTTTNTKSNPQQLYTRVTSLVQSHPHALTWGPCLYAALVQHLRTYVWEHTTTITHRNTHSMYQNYTRYLFQVSCIFATLDQQYLWNPDTQQAHPNPNNHPNNNNNTPKLSNIWHTGLKLWAQRLEELQLDTQLYQTWLQAFQQRQNDNMLFLANTWSMWKDLHTLPWAKLYTDLSTFWRHQILLSSSCPCSFLQTLWETHQHIQHAYDPWLLVHAQRFFRQILDQACLAPFLNLSNENNENNMTLMHPPHFDTLMREASNNNNNNNIMTHLWQMAGRLRGGHAQVQQAFLNYVKTTATQIIQDNTTTTTTTTTTNTDPCQLPQALWTFHQQLQKHALDHWKGFDTTTFKPVWEDLVNQHPNTAERLAKYIDSVLRNNKKLDQMTQNWLPNFIQVLFTPLHAKDTFEAFYKRDLAKRLLWNKIVNMDVEKEVVSLLKAECGTAYTAKMEGMFQDIDWSRESMLLYKQQTDSIANRNAVDMDVQVLTTGYWPLYPQYPNLQLPESLQEPQEEFTTHYKNKYQGRRITWQYALGHCIVKCNGFSKSYEVIVSLLQAVVLIQFESSDSRWTLPALMQAVGFDPSTDRAEMERILQSLSMGKEGTRILVCEKQGSESADSSRTKRSPIDDTDVFRINEEFESNQRRIRIMNLAAKETKEERVATVESVSRDRLYALDAVLVRIMKARKSLPHQVLVAQVMEEVKFPTTATDIKKRMEVLIEREYMERDAKDHSRYNYLA